MARKASRKPARKSAKAKVPAPDMATLPEPMPVVAQPIDMADDEAAIAELTKSTSARTLMIVALVLLVGLFVALLMH